METFDIVIRFRYDNEIRIKDVEAYGRVKDCDPFFFVSKGGKKSFYPISQVVYIGPYEHFHN